MEFKLITTNKFKEIGLDILDKLYGSLIDIIAEYLESNNGVLVKEWEYERGCMRQWIISDNKKKVYTITCKGQINKFNFVNDKVINEMKYIDVPRYHYGVTVSEDEIFIVVPKKYMNYHVIKSYSVTDLKERLEIKLEQGICYGNTVIQYHNEELYLVISSCEEIYVYSAKNGVLKRKIKQKQIRDTEPIIYVYDDKLYYITKEYNKINVVNHITGEFVREYTNPDIGHIHAIIVNKNDIIIEGNGGIYLCDNNSGKDFNKIKSGGGLNSLAIYDNKLLVRENVNESISRIKVYE